MIVIQQSSSFIYSKQLMGDQVSCCNANQQLANINQFPKISLERDHSFSDKNESVQVVQKQISFPLSQKIYSILAKASKTTYFKCEPKQAIQAKNLFFKSNQLRAMYQGELLDGYAQGYGKVFFEKGQYFEGNFSKGEPVNGIFIFNESCYFVGDLDKYQASGEGIYQNIQNGYYYEGQWKKNLQHGEGLEKYSNKDEYKGQFMYGSKFGEGQYKFSDGKIYTGSFYNGHSDGHGKLILGNGDSYEGQWKLGKFHGKGVYKWKSGQKYDGEYVNGVRENKGIYYFKNGAYYSGQWVNGLQNGQGCIVEGYDQVRGVWAEGKKVD